MPSRACRSVLKGRLRKVPFTIGSGILAVVMLSLFAGEISAQDDGSVVDLLIVWTELAEKEAGGPDKIEAHIRQAVADLNLTRAASQINQKVRLVHSQRIDYNEPVNGSTETDVDNLIRHEQVLSFVPMYGADLVSMVVSRPGHLCGAGETLSPQNLLGAPRERYSVVRFSCLPAILAHETGHNAGAGHQHGAPGEPGFYSYSHAWVSSVVGTTEKCGTAVAAPSNHLDMPFYSNPNVNFRFGHPPLASPPPDDRPFLFGKMPEPEIVSPVPGSALSGSSVTFRWNAQGYPVLEWWLTVGATHGGNDIYDSGPIGARHSHTVSANFPTDGSRVYVRLKFRDRTDVWRSADAVYNVTVFWKETGSGNAVVSRNPVTGDDTPLATLPGVGISRLHTGHADYRNLYFTIMFLSVPPGGPAIHIVHMVTGDYRTLRRPDWNSQPVWVHYFRDGLHAAIQGGNPSPLPGVPPTDPVKVFVFDPATVSATEGYERIPDTRIPAGGVGPVGQPYNLVRRTETDWVLEFGPEPLPVILESGGPCYGKPAGTPVAVPFLAADNARTLRETASVVANFRQRVVEMTQLLTVAATGTGSGTVGGGGTYATSTVVGLSATPASGSAFVGFAGHPDCLDGRVTMTGDRYCEAKFELVPSATSHTLSVTRAGGPNGSVTSNVPGIQCGADCSETYANGSIVILTATPATGFMFGGWSGDADCLDGRVSMTVDRVCMATFLRVSQSLVVTKAGTGIGTVVSDFGGIDCGTDCRTDYAAGAVVTLNAVPDSRSIFSHWGGDADCLDGRVTMSTHVTCSTTFLRVHRLTVTSAGTGSGSITSVLPGIACGTDCAETYLPGTTVNLMPTPGIGSAFNHWSGDAACSDGVVAISADVSCVANFSRRSDALKVLVDASRSDAVWWSPQVPPYNPEAPHQGKVVVDALRSQAVVVVERATTPTCAELSQYHLVVVSDRAGEISSAEQGAYVRYVTNGGRLMLLEDLDAGNILAQTAGLAATFGLSFGGWSTGGFNVALTPHPITAASMLHFHIGRLLTGWPASTTILGRLDTTSPQLAVLGTTPVGTGEIFFTGDTDSLYVIPQPFFNNLFGYMLADARIVSACNAVGFTDDPIVAGNTAIKVVHIGELRTRINAIRIAKGLATYMWTDSNLIGESSIIKAAHIMELRGALTQAYAAAGVTAPTFSDPSLGIGFTAIRAVHINELRSAIVVLE